MMMDGTRASTANHQLRNPRRIVWGDTNRWPINPSGYLSLVQATHQVGVALYGDKWTFREPIVEVDDTLPDTMPVDVNLAQLYRADWLLRNHDATYQARVPYALNAMLLNFDQFEWALASLISTIIADQQIDALNRYFQVERWLAQRFEAGAISTAVRPFAGGSLKALDRAIWNTERVSARFIGAQMHPDDLFSPYYITEGGLLIFVDAESLNRTLADLTPKAVEVQAAPLCEATEYLSPYVRFMIDVTRRLEFSPENQPKKSQVVAVIREMAAGRIEMSERLIQPMATFLRDPESKLGRNRSRKAV